MALDYYHNVDLKANQLLNSRLHNISTAARIILGGSLGIGDKGYMVYDTDLSSPYFWDGTQWLAAGGGGSIGPGTTNYVPKWDSLGTNIIDSQIFDDGVYVRVGNGGGNIAFPYETLILEANKDMKFGTYTSVNNFAAGGASYVLGYTNITTALGYYPGFEFQMSGAAIDADNFIRYNFLQRNAAGIVVAANPNIFNIYADNRVSFKKLIGTGTEMVVADASGFISRQAIPSVTPAALTKVDDTNVTLTLGGSPSAALLAATSLTLGWTGTLADSRIASASTWNAKVGGTGTATRVAFWDTGSSISSDADLYWDNTLKRLGIGTTTPGYKLDVNGEINTNNGIRIGNNGAQTGLYGGANILDTWAGNAKIATWGLAAAGGTIYNHNHGWVLGATATGESKSFRISSSITSNGTNSANVTQLLIDPTYNQLTFGTGILRGIYYNPTLSGLNGSPHIAYHNTSGDIIHGNLATGGAAQMVTADSNGKLGIQTIPSGTGTVTGVTATSPITSSGGTAPNISTSMATNKLIGRSTAGVGVMEEITVGTGLSLSGGTLSTSGISGGILHGTAAGTDTYTVTITGVASYADGDAYLVRFTNGNTGGCTLNVNGLGARTLYRNNDGVLIGGDIIANGDMLCVYDVSLPGFRVIGTAPNTLLGYVTNADSVTITKGQVVYAFGGQGDRMTVKLAYNTGDATSAKTVGVVFSASIGVNQKGLIMMQGLLDGLSILPTSTWADGASVYLGSTPGSITPTKQYAPNHLVYVGTVTTASNGSAGRMYVNIQNGYELDELHNVQAQSPSLKDTLWYDNAVSPAQWKTASIPTILGYTPIQRSVNLVSSGTTAAGSTAGTDYVYLVSGTATITLPTAVGNTNRYTIKNSGTGVVSIATTSSQTIDGSASPITINTQYVSLDLISNNTNWEII